MPQYFTLSESEKLLPVVESALRAAILHKAEYQKANQDLEDGSRRIRMSGGSQVNRGEFLSTRVRRDGSAAALKAALEQIEETGALVKDLDTGLIDFLTRYHGREVCLCWRLGEDRIRFWHGTDEGFRGRKPIDEEFVKSHRGDAKN